ncbi:MAG: tetratricopeptide repeat protein [Planctomycetaceae bacterium]
MRRDLTDSPSRLLESALAAHRRGELSRAESLYGRLLRVDGGSIDGWHLLGVSQHQQGRHDEAETSLRRAIQLGGDSAAMHSNLGTILREQNRPAEAEACLRRALQLSPQIAEFHYNLGNLLQTQSRRREAASAFREAIRRNPGLADAHNNLGDVLQSAGKTDEAESAFRNALQVDSRHADARFNLANLYRGRDRLPEALDAYRAAVAVRPGFVDAWVNLGYTLDDLGRLDEAVDAYSSAIAADPHTVEAHVNRALALLRQGNFRRGWAEYDWRLKRGSHSRAAIAPPADLPAPGASVRIPGEQGIGDEVMFASCLPDIARRCRCLASCDPRLVALFARSFPEVEFVPRTADPIPGQFRDGGTPDARIPLGSLPRFFRPNVESYPAHSGFLVPPARLVRQWRDRFRELHADLIVGVSWRGGNDAVVRRRRTTQPSDWRPVFDVDGVAFVNLQYGAQSRELAEFESQTGTRLHDWDDVDAMTDLDGFAAQIAALDLVISVDNSTVHLAGALGKRVWTLLPVASDWRWMMHRDDSPWYPAMRLFRQTTFGEWRPVFQRVADELQKRRSASVGRKPHDSPAETQPDLPRDPVECNNRGVAAQQAGDLDQALRLHARAHAIAPQHAEIAFNLGNVHRVRDETDAAIAAYETTLRHDPEHHRAAVNRCTVLNDVGRCKESVAGLNAVLRQRPDLPAARFNRALAWLKQGDWERGWDEYEWRFQHEWPRRSLSCPVWDGRSSAKLTLLVESEQGIGDVAMFASCLPDVSQTVKRCIVECDPRLVPLFARSFASCEVVASPVARSARCSANECDARISMGSLPRLLRRSENAFPSHGGYLAADAKLVARRRGRLDDLGKGPKVGVSWRGGKDDLARRRRSVPLADWSPVFSQCDVHFICVQHGAKADELDNAAEMTGVTIHKCSDVDPLRDVDEFAAQLSALDLVITVDNSTAHLAGALGTPVWTLLPFACDWRWMTQRRDSPWYPAMQLFRQQAAGDWRTVMDRVAERLLSLDFGSPLSAFRFLHQRD